MVSVTFSGRPLLHPSRLGYDVLAPIPPSALADKTFAILRRAVEHGQILCWSGAADTAVNDVVVRRARCAHALAERS